MSWKKHFKELLYISGITLALFTIADLLMGRFYPKVYQPQPYGWEVVADLTYQHSIQDTKGSYREVTNQYFDHGFKRWPPLDADKKNVLILGDSFTQMAQVSNGEEWYAYLEKAFPEYAFYVFGGSGYGTLQEFMVLQDHMDQIKPQAIIWQFCVNDYVNNFYALDRREFPFNNHAIRPYWENNQIVYRLPLPLSSLRQWSFAADQLLYRFDQAALAQATQNLAAYTEQQKQAITSMSPEVYDVITQQKQEAIEVTQALLQQVRSQTGEIPIYFFNAWEVSNLWGSSKLDDQVVCKAAGFHCIDFIHDHVESLEAMGKQLRVENDGHWNLEGNREVGQRLANYLKTQASF